MKTKKNLIGSALAVLLGLCGNAAWSTPITYNVNATHPGNSDVIWGTITTDGTIGELSAANYLAWDLHADVNSHLIQFSVSSSDAGVEVVCRLDSCALAATDAGLLVQSSIKGEGQLYFGVGITPPGIHDYKYIAFSYNTDYSGQGINVGATQYIREPLSGSGFGWGSGITTLGAIDGVEFPPPPFQPPFTSVPEPETITLLGLGLLGLGVARRRVC